MKKKFLRLFAAFLSVAFFWNVLTVCFPVKMTYAESVGNSTEVETMMQQKQDSFTYEESFENYDETDVRWRARIDLNWRFIQSDPANASAKDYDDSSWRMLNLPHDWGIEGEYDKANASGGSGGYLPGGIGWYRKELEIPEEWRDGRQVSLAFDGVYCNSTVYVDGVKVGGLEYGWLSFSCDITEQVQGKDSVTVAVKVDNSVEPSARWYTGSGIYSHVWVVSTEKVHVAENGTYVVTPGTFKGAPNGDVEIETVVQNDGSSAASVSVRSTVYRKSDDAQVAQVTGDPVTLSAGSSETVKQSAHVDNPLLWSVDEPNLYYLKTEILSGGAVVDDYITEFGFRHISYDATGLYLNGVNTELQGVANHWALGALGAAQSDNMIRYKIQMMKDMGVNCIRTAHNACPPTFYQLCDEMGMMVLDEFSEGEKGKVAGDYATRWFQEYWQRDIEYWVRRDRNHPSVVVWSIGNETGSQYDNTGIGEFIDQFDTTRPTTGSWIYYGVDIPGANGVSERNNYASEQRPDDIKDLPLIATEAPHTHAVRGVYRTQTWARGTATESVGAGNYLPHLAETEIFRYDWSSEAVGARIWPSDYDNAVSQISVRQHWTLTRDTDWRIGEFRWTGFDYLGEANYVLGGWPYRMFHSGAVDTALFEKSMYYLYQSMWLDEPVLHILPSWTQPTFDENTIVPVWVYSNCETVKLYLNGELVGEQTRGPMDQREYLEIQFDFNVAYKPGTLTAVGYDAEGNEVLRDSYVTASAPAGITLENTTGEELPVDESWVGQVTVTTVDKDGNFYPYGENRAYYYVSGPAYIKAADNGSPTDTESHVNYNRNAFMGLNKVFVAPTQDEGDILFTAASIVGEKRQLTSNQVSIDVQQLALRGNPAKDTFEIYYTTDGTTPTKSSKRYTGAFEVALETTVKAAVYVAGSDVPMFIMEEAFGADEGMYWEGTGTSSVAANAVNANDAVITGEKISLKDFDYVNKYVDFGGAAGSAEFTYTASAAGEYYMAVNYNNGTATIGEAYKTMNISVNGVSSGDYKFVSNGSWGTFWSTRIVKVTLQAGENKIRISSTAAGANLKDLYFWPVDDVYTSSEAVLPNADGNDAVKDHETCFDGKAIDVGSNGGSAEWEISNRAPGTYKVAFFYSTTNGSLREVSLKVNGTVVSYFSGKKTSPNYGATWGFEEAEIYLAPGVNTVTVTAPTGGTLIGGLTLVPVSYSPITPVNIDASCVEDVRLSADGMKLSVAGNDDTSSASAWNVITNPDGRIYLVSRESGRVLVSDGKTASLALGETDGNALWTRISETEHYDYIEHVKTGKVIAISDSGTLFMDLESNYLPGNLETNRAYWYFRDLPQSEFKFSDGLPTQKKASDKPFFVTAEGGASGVKPVYSVVSGPATIDSARGRVTLDGTPGTVVIQATLPAYGPYESQSITHSITVTASDVAMGPATEYMAVDAEWFPVANGSYTAFAEVSGAGGSFVDFKNAHGSIVFTVTVPEAGDYYLGVGYSTSNERYYRLSVNGTDVGTFTCGGNGGWTVDPSYHIVTVSLRKGENTVTLAKDDAGGVPCFSRIVIWDESEWKTSKDAPDTAVSTVACNTAFDGVAYDTGNSQGTITHSLDVPVSGTYRVSFSWSSGGNNKSLAVLVNGVQVGETGARTTSGGYGKGWKFYTTEEFSLKAGEDVPVTLSWSGGAYLSGLRLELVEADPEVNDFDVTWSDMNFTYRKGEWNADTHAYEDGGWQGETGGENGDPSITVSNVGETDIVASLGYAPKVGYEDYVVTVLLNGGKNVPVELWKGDEAVFQFSLSAPAPAADLESVPIGSLILAINPAE